jgi:MoaA/NifB/PqqE/SkfB family radical SAM enzyme
MYRFDEIQNIHLEITSLCNARCPMCLRNVSGGKTNPLLPLKELSLVEIKKIFPIDLLTRLKKIYLCGNYGDPMLAKDTLSSFEYFRSTNKSLKLQMFTNGSAKEFSWWRELAKLKVEVHFGIDGLSDTHSIYRRNTVFETVISNAKEFISSGGIARWDFIIFKHNQHQIEEARAASEKMGFASFRAKKTGRFFSNRAGEVKIKQDVLSANGNVEYSIEMPNDEDLQNASLKKEADIIRNHGSFESYLNKTKIQCKVVGEKSVFISAEGLLFPCCWTAIQLYPWYQKPESGQVWNILKACGGKDSISLLKSDWKKILSGNFFSQIENSWNLSSITEGKLKVCSRICGAGFDPFKDQFRN